MPETKPTSLPPVQSSKNRLTAKSRIVLKHGDNAYYATISVPDFTADELDSIITESLNTERRRRSISSGGRSAGKKPEARG